MKIEIKNRFNDKVILCGEYESIGDCLEKNRDADLRGADLRGEDLRGADLWGANLRGADLRGADLRGADLRDADLRDADLRDADLWGADLRDADLRGADLWGANLRGADLRGAKYADFIITHAPIMVDTQSYYVYIFGSHMKIGCKLYTHKEWTSFAEEQIYKMADDALEFWTSWKKPLLAMCKIQAEKAR